MIVTGEASGDLHGANLVHSMNTLAPDLSFFGMGGPALKKSGVDVLFDAARISVVGLLEVFSHLGDILAARRCLIEAMKQRKPALLILIDFPDFNLMLAGKAKKLGIPVFYYISPQVWAWRSGRANKIGRLAERVGVILPFEKDFYRTKGVDVDFVGHPLMDAVATTTTKPAFKNDHNIDPHKTVVGLLPGSRKKEISSLLPDFLSAARILSASTDKEYVFLVPRAPTVSAELLEENGIAEYRKDLDIMISDDHRYDLMAACDAVVAASGTVILELAILGVPIVTAYRFSPRTYRLGKLLIKLKWFSLVNLIAGREIIPELLQDEVTGNNIAAHLKQILLDEKIRAKIIQGLDEVRDKLGQPGASQRAAEIALEIIHDHEQ